MRTPTASDDAPVNDAELITRLLDEGCADLVAQMDASLLEAYAVRWQWDGTRLIGTPVTYEEISDAT